LPTFLDDLDHGMFSVLLAKISARHGWICHSYCEMTNHFHLILETPEAKLAPGMRELNGEFARTFNRRHRRQNHLFGGRYGSTLIKSEPHLLAACRYVVLNPTRAGLCRRPEDWPWSSYRATVGVEAAPTYLETDWLLAQFSDDQAEAQSLYRDFVREGMAGDDVLDALGARHVSGTRQRADAAATHAARHSCTVRSQLNRPA
jgi:REP element-mobilizing transposase RayT